MNCCSRKSLIERKGCMWGSREHGCLGYERREKEDAKNKLSALLFCHGLVQILVSVLGLSRILFSSERRDIG